MFAPATLALFTSASLLLAVAPGPDNIFVLPSPGCAAGGGG